jgi:integrase
MRDPEILAAPDGATLKDEQVPGLQLRVRGARRTWFLYYRSRRGAQRRPRIGDWPTIRQARARAIAREMLERVAAGEDPSAERQAARAAPTVAELLDRYQAEHGDRKKSAAGDRSVIARWIRPRLGTAKVADLTHGDVVAWHAAIPRRVAANRALACLSKAMSLAVRRWQWHPGPNPCQGVERNRERRRRRYMTVDEARRIAAALDVRQARYPQAVAFIRLLIWTGARRGEIARARWSDVHGSTIRLREHKADADGSERVIHLPPQAIAVLRSLPRVRGGTITGIDCPHKCWVAVRKAAGCPDLRMHDLRHSFASAALAAGVSLHQIGELLGHRSAQTTKGYAHLLEEAGTAAARAAGDLIAARMSAGQDRDDRHGRVDLDRPVQRRAAEQPDDVEPVAPARDQPADG